MPGAIAYQLLKHPSALFRHATLILRAQEVLDHPGILPRYEPTFNSSSIVIRGDIVRPWLGVLQRLSGLDDTFYFYCTLLANRSVILSSKRMTRYRLHTENASYYPTGASGVRLAQASTSTARYLSNIRELRRVIKAEGRGDSLGLIGRDELYLSLVHGIETSASDRRDVGRNLLQFVREPMELLAWKNLVVSGAAFTRAVLPQVSNAVYARIG